MEMGVRCPDCGRCVGFIRVEANRVKQSERMQKEEILRLQSGCVCKNKKSEVRNG